MDAFVKSFATYRTIRQASVISNALTIDALEAETSTVTVVGTTIGRSNTGDWLIIDGGIYRISAVKPQKDRTILTLTSPLEAFSRTLEYAAPPDGQSIGGFIADTMVANWVQCEDAVYSMPYLVVSNSDTTAFAIPELNNNGCFSLAEYCRLMRKSYRVTMRFFDGGNTLQCAVSCRPRTSRKVSFEDGRSQLQSVDYSSSGTAKLTVLQDVDTGEKDENGEPILQRNRTVWYLSEDGTASQTIPARRAAGDWGTITVSGDADVAAKVTETFAKNKANHKLEFWSALDLSVQDDCTFLVYGELLYSYISYKRKSSEDKRYYYKSGELATTASEKLRGVTK